MIKNKALRSLVVMMWVLFASFAARIAGSVPVGSEFSVWFGLPDPIQVDTGVSSNGDFLVVWQDGDLMARRFDSSGSGIGAEFEIASDTSGGDGFPRLAVAPSGDFVVVWERVGGNGPDTDGFGVAARRFASDGSALGDDFQVNTVTASAQLMARVASAQDGGFVVAWRSFLPPEQAWALRGQRFASDGSPLAGELQLAQWPEGYPQNADLAVDTKGGFVVTWDYSAYVGNGDFESSIWARRFASDGSAATDPLLLSTVTNGAAADPQAVFQPNGDFIVVWGTGTEAGAGKVLGRRLASNGQAIGDFFQVNEVDSDIVAPALAAEPNGGFSVVWDGPSLDGELGFQIYQRSFKADATPRGPSIQINTEGRDSLFPRLALGEDGRGVVVWTRFLFLTKELRGRQIDVGQLIFADGFETGSTAAWSSSPP